MGKGIIRLESLKQLTSQERNELRKIGVNTRSLVEHLDYTPAGMFCGVTSGTEKTPEEKPYSQNND